MIILLFGQPASGKTTLARLLVFEGLINNYFKFINIDGDKWRLIRDNKDYSRQGRINNLLSAFDMALYLEAEGYTPIISFVAPYEETRNYMAQKCNLKQIYLTYDGDRGRNNYFATDFEEPKSECLKLNTSELNLNDSMEKILEFLNIVYI